MINKKLQLSIFDGKGKLIAVFAFYKCDITTNQSLFYMRPGITESNVFRLIQHLQRIEMRESKIILTYGIFTDGDITVTATIEIVKC